MALGESGLSVAALALRTALHEAKVLKESSILVGHPSAAQAAAAASNEPLLLNLFFYRIEPGAYPSDATFEDPYFVRLFCLVTPFSNDDASETEKVTAGESDLRLIGSVVACFHANPMLLIRYQDAAIARLQVVPTPLTLEAMNNLWSTQKDVPYRLSVAYELALVPAQLTAAKAERSPLVVELKVREPSIGAVTATETPQLALLDTSERRTQVLITTVADTPLEVWLVGAGHEGAELELRWSRWTSTDMRPSFEPLASSPLDKISLKANWGAPVRALVDRSHPGQVLVSPGDLISRDGARHTVDVNRLVIVIRPEVPA